METSRNFDLRLSGTLAAVSVEIDSPAGQHTAPPAPCNVSPQALEDLRDAVPGVDLKAIGNALWRCAFGDAVARGLWERSKPDPGSDGILRLRLIIDAAVLAALPWELLYDETLGRFLALDAQTPVTRFTRLPIPSAPWPQDRPLRLLFTGSSPADMPTLNVAKEWTGIEHMTAPLVKQGRLEIPDPIPEGATPSTLLAALRRKVDIWHFAGHGSDSGLVFCKDHNKAHPVDVGELGQMLVGEGVRLAVINACRAGAGGGQAASVAGALLRANIPSVIAMQSNVSDVAADAFAAAFYDAIAVELGVDQAVTAARKAMWAAGTSEWWTPALFMRTPEGRIWRVPVKGAETEERARELAYLDGVIEKYQYWAEKYTPLAGVAEVRVPVEDHPRLGLPMLFMPTGFDKLQKHGFGARWRIGRVPVDDLRNAVDRYKRLVILGEPGSGKTTTMWRLAYDLAVTAKADPQAPLPLLVPLGGYLGPENALTYTQSYFEEMGPHLPAYLRSKRVVLLLDALNEMPRTGYIERVGRIKALLDHYPETAVVVTCRALDYVETLDLEKLEIRSLDPERQREYLHRYLGVLEGEKLFRQMTDGYLEGAWSIPRHSERAQYFSPEEGYAQTIDEGVAAETEIMSSNEGGEDGQLFFELSPPLFIGYRERFDVGVDVEWVSFLQRSRIVQRKHRAIRRSISSAIPNGNLPPLLTLGQNPYMLVMLAQVFASSNGVLPQNRGRLFAAFVDTLLEREKMRCDLSSWPGADILNRSMARLAFVMQETGERGTAVNATWVAEQIAQPGVGAAQIIYLCASATLFDAENSKVRFVHQSIQEYFAALALADKLRHGDDLRRYWPGDWTTPSGWEETVILLAGLLPDMTPLIENLLKANPPLAARCIAESGGEQLDEHTVQQVQKSLVKIATSRQAPVIQRNAAGDALNYVGDPRFGVALTANGIPEIHWCQIPIGKFVMGNTWETDSDARVDETPRHMEFLEAFEIGKHLITNVQFDAFVRDGGYRSSWRHCWTDDGWRWKELRRISWGFGGMFDLPNHPVAVTWYEAVAFCNWLSEKLGKVVRLPTEVQWERAARYSDGRRYPWSGHLTQDHANYFKTRIGATSAVGIFPKGVSVCGALDMSGNRWEWCGTKWRSDYNSPPDEDPQGHAARVLRGGSYASLAKHVRCAARGWGHPSFCSGFRVVALTP